MKQYILDEIARPDLPRIKAYLDEKAQPSGLEGIWWVELGKAQLSEAQMAHPDCQPHCIAVELGRDFVKFEFLVRSRRTMRCTLHRLCHPAAAGLDHGICRPPGE